MKRLKDQIEVLTAIAEVSVELQDANRNDNKVEIAEVSERLTTLYRLLDAKGLAEVLAIKDTRDKVGRIA